MPTLKNVSSRPYHVDGTILLPGAEMEVSDERADSKPLQGLLDTHDLVLSEDKPKPAAPKPAAPPPAAKS